MKYGTHAYVCPRLHVKKEPPKYTAYSTRLPNQRESINHSCVWQFEIVANFAVFNNYKLLTEFLVEATSIKGSRTETQRYSRLSRLRQEKRTKKNLTVINYYTLGKVSTNRLQRCYIPGAGILAYSLPRLIKSVKAVLLKSFFLDNFTL